MRIFTGPCSVQSSSIRVSLREVGCNGHRIANPSEDFFPREEGMREPCLPSSLPRQSPAERSFILGGLAWENNREHRSRPHRRAPHAIETVVGRLTVREKRPGLASGAHETHELCTEDVGLRHRQRGGKRQSPGNRFMRVERSGQAAAGAQKDLSRPQDDGCLGYVVVAADAPVDLAAGRLGSLVILGARRVGPSISVTITSAASTTS